MSPSQLSRPLLFRGRVTGGGGGTFASHHWIERGGSSSAYHCIACARELASFWRGFALHQLASTVLVGHILQLGTESLNFAFVGQKALGG